MIRDDWEPWGSHNKNTIYGKPLVVDQSDYDTLQIFFDDNIHETPTCIVDVRDVETGKSLPIEPTGGQPNGTYLTRYMVQVDIIAAILKKSYFWNIILECERLRMEDIERREGGG